MAERFGQVARYEESVSALRRRGAADQERVLAVRGLVGLHGEDGVAGDVLDPEIGVDGAGFEVFGEERLGLRFGLLGGRGGEGGRKDQGEENGLEDAAGHGEGYASSYCGIIPMVANQVSTSWGHLLTGSLVGRRPKAWPPWA